LFELLDRQRFELFAYSLTAPDGSAIGTRIREAADYCRNLETVLDSEAAHQIRRDEIDILMDVAGHATGSRFAITAYRPAPVQVQYLAFAGSLGSSRVDYAIADDRVAPAEASNEWSESLVRLPSTYYLYDYRRSAGSPAAVTREDYGLPANAFVYCAFHKAEKITPDAFSLWMEILNRVPGSILWFAAMPSAAAENLRRAATTAAIEPSRLVFAPFESRERYFARQRLGDLLLDTQHHSAMTTACDALGAGLPMLTTKGAAMSSRAGESLLHAAGIPELIASGKDEFTKVAVQLASNRSRLASYRNRLANRNAPLFDTARRVRELESALIAVWQRHERGATPASFDVQAL
jgi:protein O-GlcNAc transferase